MSYISTYNFKVAMEYPLFQILVESFFIMMVGVGG